MADKMVDSTSDARTVNNIMRHQYRTLTDYEKRQMGQIKDIGLAFADLLHHIGGSDSTKEFQHSRELSLAQTKIEEAVMWAVKHLTK